MFQWLKTWWQNRTRQQHRTLFPLWDGARMKRLDPWAVHRALLGAPGFGLHEQLPAALRGEEPELSKAREALCVAFQVTPYDAERGTGLTDEELFATLDSFLAYCDALEKKTLGLPISSPASAPRASTGRDYLDRVTS